MNRITVAKYLDLMTVEGKLELRLFGKSKVYFRARNVPARSLTEYTSNLILILDNEHHVVMCNPRFLDFAGLSEKDTIGASISEIPCDLIEKIMPLFGQGYEQTEKMLEISLKRYNHSYYFLIKIARMEFVENPAGWEIVIEDITKRKVAEIELIQSEQKYRALVEQVSEAFVTVDLKGTIKSYKKTVRDLTDFTEDDIINHNIREFILPESSIDNPVFLFNTKYLMDPRKNHVPIPCQMKNKNGVYRWYELTISPDVDTQNRPRAIFIAMRDIHELKKAQDAIKSREQVLDAIVNRFEIPQFGIGPDHIILFWNAGMEHLTGIPAKKVLGTKDHEEILYAQKKPCLVDFLLENELTRKKFNNEQVRQLNLSQFKFNAGECSAIEHFDGRNLAGNSYFVKAAILEDAEEEVTGAVQQFIELAKYVP
jgi:PAS domain S-box-containing protein